MSNAAFTTPLGPNPWLDWPCPISLEQPKLQITLTNFHCHYLPRPLHPYSLNIEPGAEATIYFHEMRGFGPPPGDVGYPGDVYIDVSPGAHGLWAIRTPNGGEWTRWTPNEIIQHPHITSPYHYLWCSTRGEVSWYSAIVHHALSKDQNYVPREAGDLIAEMLRANARRPKRRDGESAEPASRKRQKLGETLDTGGGNTLEYLREKSPSIVYASLSTTARLGNESAAPIPPSIPGSETALHEETLTANVSKRKFGSHNPLSTEMAQHQLDGNSHRTGGQCQSALTVTNACQLLPDANEKLPQKNLAPPGTRMESSGKQPSKCSDGSESINPDTMATSRMTSTAVIPSASVGGTRFDQIVASFDDILYDLLKAEHSKKETETAHSAQMISMLQNKEEMRAELAVMTEQKAILEMKIERMKRAVAEC